MKILDLRLQAFGPFLKEQHIDFESLNDKGMFLINGPTGTGKTSIFDGIVYALYGQGSGSDRDNGKSLRSDFAKDEDITFVELKFEANGQIYKIRRTGEYTRKAQRGNGIVNVPGTAELTMPDGSIISGTKAVDEKIINDILFINIKQFKNIALLAQGEFTELVTAKTPERAKILEHIFQKEIYDEFQDKILEKFKKANDAKNAVISSINTLITQVEDGNTILGYQEALNEPSNIPAFVENLEEVIKKLSEDKKSKETALEQLKKDYEESYAQLKNIEQDNEQIKNYLKAVDELKELSAKQAEIDELKKKLEVQLEMDAISPFIAQQDKLKKELKTYEDEIEQLKVVAQELSDEEKWIKENKENYEKAKEQISALQTTLTNLQSIIKQIASLIKEKRIILQKEDAFAENFAHFEKQEELFKQLRKRFFVSISHNLAQQLEDDQPCPVCGSIHHPHPAEMVDPVSENTFNTCEAELKKEEQLIGVLQNQLTQAQSEYNTKLASIIKTLQENGFPEADEAFVFGNNLSELYDEKEQAQIEYKKFALGYEQREIQFKTNYAKYEQRVLNNASRRVEISNDLKELEEKINGIFEKNVHVKSTQIFDACLKTKIYVNSTKTVIEEHNRKVIAAKATIDATPKKLVENGSVDASELAEATTAKNNAYLSASEEYNKLDHKISNLNRSANSIKAKYHECENIINRYTSLLELSKVARGENRMKLSFKMYILADYFDKIIVQANKRLHRITNGRYKLVRRDTIKGGGQQGLDLDVYDVETGKNRPASSLSGGEKFVSALSMALGLSDIIETNHALIQVESIFIDEGFGSLDEDYLDMAMKALESLKEDNKTIAIISHVEKLKEYIPDGIEVKKDTVGSKIVLKENI